tara:strand:+ start:862 stop:1710 length:849 start_codon:yes stop_codon:yes gene_type:complete
MNKEKNKLGRGLSALLSNKNTTPTDSKEYKVVNISSLKPNKEQPRTKFKKEELKDLASSIKTNGMLQPILVRRFDNDTFEIVAGERRWRSAQIAGLHEVPIIVKTISNTEVMQIALIENIQRENLNPVEEAKAYKKLLDNNSSNFENLTNLIHKSRSHISNMVRLLELDERILNLVEEEKISMGHARTLIGVPNGYELAKEIISKKLSVRDVEKSTSRYKKTHKKIKKNQNDPNITDLEKELSEKIGLKTSIEFNEEGSSGSITLYYSNLDQLDDIMRRLKK